MLKQRKSNTEDLFGTEHLKADLKGRSIRGGAVTVFAQGGRFVLQMSSAVVLGRLLTPEDYGLIAMVSVVIRFVQMFKNLGLSAATVQKEQINHRQVSTLFWINFGLSFAISTLFILIAPAVAWFYQEPRLTNIMLVLAGLFLIGGVSIQHQALMKRQMRFTRIAQINLSSFAIGVIVGIVSAWYGAGYWALVVMQLTIALSYSIGIWLACSWRPGLPAWDSGIRSMLAFGGNLTAFSCVNYFSRNLDNILIGRYWGSQELGLYAKAYQLILLPIQQINIPVTSVAMPTLSCLQSQPEQYRRYYYKAILAITIMGMPLVAFTFAVADKIILFLLGEKWMAVVPIFQFLMPAAFMGTFNVAGGWVYQSLGRTDRQLRIGLIMSTIDVLIFLISVRWGVIAVAAAYGLSRPILWVPRMLYCYQGTPLRFTKLVKTLSRPAIASLSAAIILMGINQVFLGELQLFIALITSIILYSLLYIAIWLVLPDGKQTLLSMIEMIKELKKKKQKKQ